MGALDGTVKTPFGPVQKKTAVIGVAGLAVLGGIVWYRQKQTADQPDANIADAEINPATGFPYGSAEDAAALAAQAAYVSPGGAGAGGGGNSDTSGSSNTPTYASNNSEWTQMVLAYFQDNGIIEDVAGMSIALGKYISGAYVTDNEVSLIQQATAVKGQPPTAGATGYPPSLNRTPPGSGGGTTPPPTGGGSSANAGPIRGKVTTTTATSINTKFQGAANAIQYIVYLDGHVYKTISGSPFSIGALRPNSHHTVGLQAVAANGTKGPVSNTTVYTKKK